jgi:hypothetical protein
VQADGHDVDCVFGHPNIIILCYSRLLYYHHHHGTAITELVGVTLVPFSIFVEAEVDGCLIFSFSI